MRRLPGDLTEEQEVASMIRVDHAGEFGAVRIYSGQLAVMKNSAERKLVEKMLVQEKEHFDKFDNMIKERKVRPTILMPLWHVAGFALGAGTALLGKKAAFACTVAVESVIEEHYQKQKERLSDNEKSLSETITKFRDEEIEHHDTSIEHGGMDTPLYPILSVAIKNASKLAIWLSTRI
ncbi:MAG: demethoxyubiquinone hydroxylase family protein [Pseudomonadota bacterium]